MVAWIAPGTRCAYPPVSDGSFVFHEARSSVVPSCLVKQAAHDVAKNVVGDHCSADVHACVRFGTFNVCTLGDGGSRSRFLAGRPALVR